MSVSAHPCREELEAVVRHYHRLEREHEHAHALDRSATTSSNGYGATESGSSTF
jgi:hypothetical protein